MLQTLLSSVNVRRGLVVEEDFNRKQSRTAERRAKPLFLTAGKVER